MCKGRGRWSQVEIALPYHVFSPCLDILPCDFTRMTHERKRWMKESRKHCEEKSPNFFFPPALFFVYKKKRKERKMKFFFSVPHHRQLKNTLSNFPSNVKEKELFVFLHVCTQNIFFTCVWLSVMMSVSPSISRLSGCGLVVGTAHCCPPQKMANVALKLISFLSFVTISESLCISRNDVVR